MDESCLRAGNRTDAAPQVGSTRPPKGGAIPRKLATDDYGSSKDLHVDGAQGCAIIKVEVLIEHCDHQNIKVEDSKPMSGSSKLKAL
jgi:hypothetical protein